MFNIFTVQFALDKNAYYAKRLHESMAGLGTDDKALIRIVATRCEIDMVDIKNAYSSKYGKSLETDIAVRIIFQFFNTIIINPIGIGYQLWVGNR